MYKAPKNESKMLAIYFNSVFYILQLLMFSKRSTHGYIEMTRLDFGRVLIPKYQMLNKKQRQEFESLFAKIHAKELDCLVEQLKDKTEFRLNLDLELSRILGLEITKSDLLELYDRLEKEISEM